MSISTIDTILDRIKTAPIYSPIAVFKINKGYKNKLNACFYNTVWARNYAKKHPEKLLGTFTLHDNPLEIELILSMAIYK